MASRTHHAKAHAGDDLVARLLDILTSVVHRDGDGLEGVLDILVCDSCTLQVSAPFVTRKEELEGKRWRGRACARKGQGRRRAGGAGGGNCAILHEGFSISAAMSSDSSSSVSSMFLPTAPIPIWLSASAICSSTGAGGSGSGEARTRHNAVGAAKGMQTAWAAGVRAGPAPASGGRTVLGIREEVLGVSRTVLLQKLARRW